MDRPGTRSGEAESLGGRAGVIGARRRADHKREGTFWLLKHMITGSVRRGGGVRRIKNDERLVASQG